MRGRTPEASAGIPSISQRMWMTMSSALAALGLVEPGTPTFWRSSPGRVLQSLQASRNFRESAGNSFYSVAEYMAQPLSMLVAAPFLVHKLGLPQYGIWMLASAILGSMGILSTGFGDATVKYVSAYRGQNNQAGIERTIRATLSINTLLGAFFGLLVWVSAPYAVDHLFKIEPGFHTASLQTIRISAVILVLRSIESVFVSTLRAFERYGPPVKLNVFLRIIVVASAVVLAATGRGVAAIMIATLFWSALIVVLQVVAARRVVGSFNPLPTLEKAALAEVFSFGCFSWLQALAAVVFSYADRFLVAAMLGTAPLAIYVLCVQVAQPIHGLSSAAFNFVFPHISSRHEAGEIHGPRRVFRLALLSSVGLCLALAAPLILFGKHLLTLWMGVEFAKQAHVVLAILVMAHLILAINIVPHYTLLAFGKVRFVSIVNVLGGILSLAGVALFVPPLGLVGAAIGRLLYGPAVALNFMKLKSQFAQAPIRSKEPVLICK
jgi:O-antigen/teichoic acid export membrane protein